MYHDASVIGPGPSVIMPSQIQGEARPTTEVVPGAAGFLPAWNYALSRPGEWELGRGVSPRMIELMLLDPAVSSSYNTHKMGILAGGMKLVSPVKQPAWSKRQGANPKPKASDDAPDGKPKADRSLTPEQSQAAEVLAFCERCVLRMRGKLGPFLFEFLDAMARGSTMAEVTFKLCEGGEDAGKLVFDRINVKPNWAWRFIVDNKMNVKGYLTYDPMGGYLAYAPDKFISLSWMPVDSDPRGTSVLAAAKNAWNLKIQSWPQYYRHLVRFGSPGLDFEMAQNDTQAKPAINADGTPKTDGSVMDTGTFYATLLGVYQSGGIFCHPFGSKLQIAEPKTDGEAFLKAIDLFDRQIALAIEYQSRAMLESKHGSRADSETAENRKGLAVAFGREWLADGVFPALQLLVRLNFGDDAAELWTPMPTFGNSEQHDKPALWTAAASLGVVVGPSQMEEMDDELGLPIRDPEQDAQVAAEQAQLAADLAVQVKGDTGSGNSEKAPKSKGKSSQ